MSLSFGQQEKTKGIQDWILTIDPKDYSKDGACFHAEFQVMIDIIIIRLGEVDVIRIKDNTKRKFLLMVNEDVDTKYWTGRWEGTEEPKASGLEVNWWYLGLS
ncbi:hypothetical protein DUI87_18386 [Hirundo rustica rustica]|uniref:Uncharacterized protein n=1 Tax=Hirundo rustica rustica TaxID=333673 RepID=A0A3M0JVY2_HIRRU|nr:hypothetical protein DUI87_18386 [Hirundo rustica rustica]